jgi:glycosyltransferase involved in cell wall biosynthesis
MQSPYFSVVVFTYNRASLLKDCVESILNQSFPNFEIIISDNCSDDDTEKVSSSFDDKRIRYFKNEKNLGLRGNLEAGTSHADGEIVFLMGDDDILLPGALDSTYKAFQKHPEAGMVTRPYYWFMENVTVPVRAVLPFNNGINTVVTVHSDRALIRAIFETAGQISGLAFRRSLMRVPFHPDIFTTHLYLFADMLKQAPAVILKDFTVAVRVGESMCRHNPEIYVKSPTESWMEMFEIIYAEQDFNLVRKYGKDMMASHCEGFLQIRIYGTLRQLIREVLVQIRYRPRNLASPRFLCYALISIVIPPRLLGPIVDLYKRYIIARNIRSHTSFLNMP